MSDQANGREAKLVTHRETRWYRGNMRARSRPRVRLRADGGYDHWLRTRCATKALAARLKITPARREEKPR